MIEIVPEAWWIPLGVCVGFALYYFFWRPMRLASQESRFAEARRRFHIQREHLEARFVTLADKARPQGPHWGDCEFEDDVAYVRDRSTGELSAFVGVAVAANDLPGSADGTGDLIGNLRAGTAIFQFRRNRWETDGRALLNLSPTEAVRFYQSRLEMVGQEFAGQS